MKNLKLLSYCMMLLIIFGSFAPFVSAEFTNPTSASGFTGDYSSVTNTYQSSGPSFNNYYSGSLDTYWPILTNLESDNCDAVRSDFIISIPVGGCSPTVVRSDLLAEQNVPVFCQLSAIKVNPMIDVSTIKSISFKGDYPDEIAGISFHPARAAVKSYATLLGDPIDENIGYVVIVLKKQPDERNLEEYISGMLTASIRYDAKGAFGTGAAEYYLEPVTDNEWNTKAADSSFWGGRGYLRAKSIGENEATIEVMTNKDDVYRTVTLEEGETSSRIYYPGQYCTAAMQVKLNKIDNSEDMAKIVIDEDTFWVREGSGLLDGKCSVRDLNVFPSGSGSIDISCSGNSKITLVLGDSGVSLNNGSEDNFNVGIGGSISGKDSKPIYLGYYGESNALDGDNKVVGNFAILFDRELSEDDVSDITGIFDVVNFKSKDEMVRSLDSFSKFKDHYEILSESDGFGKYGIDVVTIGFEETSSPYADTFIPSYLGKAKDTVLSLVDDYSSEKKGVDDYWGEDALRKQIVLAGLAKNEDMQADLIGKFLSEYPDSDSVEYMRDLRLSIEQFDHSGASANVIVNNDNYNIRVEGFAVGSGADDSVSVRFRGGALHTLKRDGVYNSNFDLITDESESDVVPRLSVVDIDGTSAKLRYFYKDDDKTRDASATIEVGDYATLGDREIKVESTKVREVAYVSLIPEVRNTKTEANFTFNIGIEKRAVELNPDKAREKIARLNESIAEWEDRIEKLGSLIKGMKGACLATGTVLTLKSLINGFSGESVGRADVMDSFEEKCKTEHPGVDLQVCYSTYYKDDINNAVDAYSDAVSSVNNKVKSCTSGSSSVKSGFFESKVIDTKAYVEQLRSCGIVDSSWSTTIDKTTITRSHLTSARDFQAVLLKEEVCSKGESVACDIATDEMKTALMDNVEAINVKIKEEENKVATGVEIPVAVNPNVDSVFQQAISAKGSTLTGVDQNNYLAQVYDPENANNRYYVELDKNARIVNVYDVGGNKVVNNAESLKSKISVSNKFNIPAESNSFCSNPINEPYVRYYEESNKQGFAAIVPIDKDNGWYVHVESKDYDASGNPTAFWICNVGKDMQMGEGVSSGDTCQYFQTSSAGSVTEFIPCTSMTPSAVKKLYDKAQNAIREANRNGNGVDIGGDFVYKTLPLGTSSSNLECTDFMSVDDCNLMFNVCDPVICPSSRCDLGGKFPVSDVVASGIVGSIALCLPNFGNPAKGGVLIPVCLTGIHAGLDAYVSILKSHRDCLEENVESGVYTGICDEITAIYTCEFFWGQISPILDTLLEKFISGLYGGFQTRGGAEYLTISKSFENLDKSINYFTNVYGKNAVNSFRLKNVEEIGGTVCKGFVGSSVPTSIESLNSLLEPESPSQFYAYFSESSYSDATVPSTSYYKVYYHIYSGNDQGTQYRIYLKNPPASSYYSTRQTLAVKSGYIAKGESADEAVDFTAPSGYKELCVSINGQDECGFGSVTSDFGLNYASQAYVKDQADDKGIETTEDCVTTSTSAWALVSPNLQSGVEDSLGQDDIATSGIIRICASTNPEAGVVAGNDVYCNPSESAHPECNTGYNCVAIEGDASSTVGYCENANGNRQISQGKWIDVGYCDNENVRCWLDSSSVGSNLDQYMAVNNLTVSDIVRESADLTELKEQYKNVAEKLGSLRQDIEELQGKKVSELIYSDGSLFEDVSEIITGLDEIAGVGDDNVGQGSNAAKAEALALKASVYMLIVEKLLEQSENLDVKIVGTSVVETKSDGSSSDDNVDVASNKESGDDSENIRGDIIDSMIYVITQEDGKEVSFVYDDGWKWSLDNNIWNDVSGDVDSALTNNVKALILNLRGKNKENGIKEIEKQSDIRIDNVPDYIQTDSMTA